MLHPAQHSSICANNGNAVSPTDSRGANSTVLHKLGRSGESIDIGRIAAGQGTGHASWHADRGWRGLLA